MTDIFKYVLYALMPEKIYVLNVLF